MLGFYHRPYLMPRAYVPVRMQPVFPSMFNDGIFSVSPYSIHHSMFPDFYEEEIIPAPVYTKEQLLKMLKDLEEPAAEAQEKKDEVKEEVKEVTKEEVKDATKEEEEAPKVEKRPVKITTSMSTFRGRDGLVHIRKNHVDGRTGKKHVDEIRKIGDKEIKICTEISPDGNETKNTSYVNLEESEVPSFDEMWNRLISPSPKSIQAKEDGKKAEEAPQGTQEE